jgi:hypothetical protein
MTRLAAILPRRGGEMTLTHQWLPHLVRLALAAGDRQIAQGAAQACQAEAAAETQPARAAAASLRCHGLIASDPDPLRDAAAHYRAVGPAVELPAALEDLAFVLADRGQEDEARAALNEAVSLYGGLQARWDIRRAEGRLRPYGIRRGARGRRGGPRGLRLGGTHADGDQDRGPGRQGCLDIRHRQGHVPVTTYRPDLHLPHPHQAWREGPGRDRPGGTAPGRLTLAGASTAARRGKVSSYDHYSRSSPAGSLDMCPARAQARPQDRTCTG